MGLVILYFARSAIGAPEYIIRLQRVIGLLIFFVIEMFIANVRVAWEVLTPRHNMTPGVIAVPLDARTNAEITLLCNLITLTPGSLSLDVSDDRRYLFIHAMYIDDADEEKRKIKDGFERRLLEVMR